MTYLNKKSLLSMLPLLAACILLLTSCDNNYGYDKKVFISAEGGSETLSGETTVAYFEFLKKDTYVSGTKTDSYFEDNRLIEIYKYEWITIENHPYENWFKVTAEPNESTRRRSMKILLSYHGTMEQGYLKVTQAGK